MSHRTNRALFVGEPSSPPMASESFLQRNVNYIHSTPKHGDRAKSPDFGQEFSEIFDGNMTITSGASDPRHSAGGCAGKKDTIQVTRTGVNFGFVAVGDEATMVYRFRNSNADEQMSFRVSLERPDSHFEVRNGDVSVGPKEEGAITLVFRAPPTPGCYQNRLFLEKLNGLYKKFTIKVIGCSGRSNVRVADSHLADGSMVYSQSGKIVFKPDFYPPPPSIVYTSCQMTLTNKGQRSAFVCVQAVDQADQPDLSVKVDPPTYIFDRDAIKRFKITIQRHDRSHNCSTKLRVLWGEEMIRQGYKAWREQSMDRTLVYGVDFAQQFPNEERYPRHSKGADVLEQSRDEFRDAIRIFEINVIDSRLMSIYPL